MNDFTNLVIILVPIAIVIFWVAIVVTLVWFGLRYMKKHDNKKNVRK